MRHLDLFSGIGGFSLAAERVWPDIIHTFVEYDPFCQAILKKHWPEAEIHGDIRAFVADAKSQRDRPPYAQTGIRQGAQLRNCASETFLLTGGFPCQPFSAAGRRRGTEDDRYLWPPMLESIRLFRPTWVVAENVAGLLTWNDGMVFETVCTDLERAGYEVGAFVIPACAVGAPHRRDRVWIVGHAEHDGQYGSKDRKSGDERGDSNQTGQNQDVEPTRPTMARGTYADPERIRRNQAIPKWASEGQGSGRERRNPWSEPWSQAATRLCTVDDGLPGGLVRPRGWRNATIKAAGNAIVPQVVEKILLTIKETYASR